MPVVEGWAEEGLECLALAPGAVRLMLTVNPGAVMDKLLMHDPASVRAYLGAPSAAWDALMAVLGDRRIWGFDPMLADIWWGLDNRGDDLGLGIFGVLNRSMGNPLLAIGDPKAEVYQRLMVRHLRSRTRALHGGSWTAVDRNRKGAMLVAVVVDSVPFTAAERIEIARWAGEGFYSDPKGYAASLRKLLVGLEGDLRRETAVQFGLGILGPALGQEGDEPYTRLTRVAILLRYLLAEVEALDEAEDRGHLFDGIYAALRGAFGEETTRALHQAAKVGWNLAQAASGGRKAALAEVEAMQFPEGLALAEAWHLWNQDATAAGARPVRHAWALSAPGTPLCGRKGDYGDLKIGVITRGEAMARRHAKIDMRVCSRCAAALVKSASR
jgi:hypothetical protein